MLSILAAVLAIGRFLGFDPLLAYENVTKLPQYLRNLRALRAQQRQHAELFPITQLKPCLHDRYTYAGTTTGHYFHQDLLVARRIHERRPVKHVDVGSRVDGFIAHVATFREIEVFDLRTVEAPVRNVVFRRVDMMSTLAGEYLNYCDSVSCLHALEHFGLGRYGDQIDVHGYAVGLANMTRLLSSGGKLYLSVPIGPQRIEFDAHRVFSLEYLLRLVGHFHLDSLSYVDDAGLLHEDIDCARENIAGNLGCTYGCAILELTKMDSRAIAQH
jgi:hypothetical protein